MNIFLTKKDEAVPYDKTEQFLKKQQDIDTLIALSRLFEVLPSGVESLKKAETKVSAILDRIT